ARGWSSDGWSGGGDGEAGSVAAGSGAVEAPLIAEGAGAAGDGRKTGVAALTDSGVAWRSGSDTGIELERRAVGHGTALTGDDHAHGVITDCQSGGGDGEAGSVAAGSGAVEAPLIT